MNGLCLWSVPKEHVATQDLFQIFLALTSCKGPVFQITPETFNGLGMDMWSRRIHPFVQMNYPVMYVTVVTQG